MKGEEGGTQTVVQHLRLLFQAGIDILFSSFDHTTATTDVITLTHFQYRICVNFIDPIVCEATCDLQILRMDFNLQVAAIAQMAQGVAHDLHQHFRTGFDLKTDDALGQRGGQVDHRFFGFFQYLRAFSH